MTEDNSISAVNLSGLSKPVNTLIKKVSDAVEGGCRPWQIKRIAKAEAAADMIHAENRVAITELEQRAMRRFFGEEAKKQENMESITEKAFPLLEADTDASKMDDDWVTNFFDKCRIVSNDQMQELWAKVLAGEANSPGSVSKRTINILGDMDQSEAQMFRTLSRFTLVLEGQSFPFIHDITDEIYKNAGLSFMDLSHLDSIGLILFDMTAGYRRLSLSDSFTLDYFDDSFQCKLNGDDANRAAVRIDMANPKDSVPIGVAMYTTSGAELQKLCDPDRVAGFADYVAKCWKRHLPVLAEHPRK